ncbi:hypothetical protein KKA13_01155 [Patescibacteria group bacterium]|nr:hypothetical protein [Patescibacteria group bacterium]MBU1613087.1 hypothetical protein [Patescibacteria group bacterium]
MKEKEHKYGEHVHLVRDNMATSRLTSLCDARTPQSQVINLTQSLYAEVLLRAVVNLIFPTITIKVSTPMATIVGQRGRVQAETIDPLTMVAIATLLRAGDIAAGACFGSLVSILSEGCVRQDFFGATRQTNTEHQVTGTEISYIKKGSLDGRVLLIPDPMGATGGSIIKTLDCYGDGVGNVRAMATLHLIITPEYIRRITLAYPDLHIFALRVDRGMSDDDILNTVPGTFPDREFGLTETQYIVPGAGDMGARLTGLP